MSRSVEGFYPAETVLSQPFETEMPRKNEEVLARVVAATYIKDSDFETSNHLTYLQEPSLLHKPATNPVKRREIQTDFGRPAKNEFYTFIAKPAQKELKVLTRSLNASPLIHDNENILGIIKTGEDNKQIAVDVIGGCGPDETIFQILDREGLTEEAVLYNKKTGKLLLGQNGHDMSYALNHLKTNARLHLERNGYVPEPFPAVLRDLISLPNGHLIEPVPYPSASPSIEKWLTANLVKATVKLKNIEGEEADPIESYLNIHNEGGDAVVPLWVPDLIKSVAMADLEWVINDDNMMFATERDFVAMPPEKWTQLATKGFVEDATIISKGTVQTRSLNLPLKSNAASLFGTSNRN